MTRSSTAATHFRSSALSFDRIGERDQGFFSTSVLKIVSSLTCSTSFRPNSSRASFIWHSPATLAGPRRQVRGLIAEAGDGAALEDIAAQVLRRPLPLDPGFGLLDQGDDLLVDRRAPAQRLGKLAHFAVQMVDLGWP